MLAHSVALWTNSSSRGRPPRSIASRGSRRGASFWVVRHRTTQNEAPRLDPRDAIDLGGRPRLDEFVHNATECASISQQGGDVPELYARLRIVPNRAN